MKNSSSSKGTISQFRGWFWVRSSWESSSTSSARKRRTNPRQPWGFEQPITHSASTRSASSSSASWACRRPTNPEMLWFCPNWHRMSQTLACTRVASTPSAPCIGLIPNCRMRRSESKQSLLSLFRVRLPSFSSTHPPRWTSNKKRPKNAAKLESAKTSARSFNNIWIWLLSRRAKATKVGVS